MKIASALEIEELPGEGLSASKMPGHWLLARMGKRVLRPGGIELTNRMLDSLHITSADRIIELAPGMGHTARRVLARQPSGYIGVDRDRAAIVRLQKLISGSGVRFVEGTAEDTGLPGESATVVYGEAMLSMQPTPAKKAIVNEAFRLLKHRGRYGIHELVLEPDCASEALRSSIEADLSRSIHHGVRLITCSEWREMLEAAGFAVAKEMRAPMHLLEPKRVVQDEGLLRTLQIAFNVLRCPEARRRIASMHSLFRKHAANIQAVSFICEKSY